MIDSASDIRFLERNEIDIAKWDRCIENAANGLIYARSFYLDTMAKNWSALVSGDYQGVMPLTWNKKWGIKYLYQPYYTKVLGVFGYNINPVEISSFLDAIPSVFRYCDIDLNENNYISGRNEKLTIHERVNYFLSLKEDYTQIRLQYKRLAIRMIKKAAENQLKIVREVDPGLIVDLYKRDYAHRHLKISDKTYGRLIKCSITAFNNKLAKTYLVKSPSGETLAYYMILKDDHFIYSLIGGSTSEGKLQGAFYLLTDTVIRDHAGLGRIFRFEGSDIPGVAFFNAQFGPKKTYYQHAVVNRLPFLFRFFK